MAAATIFKTLTSTYQSIGAGPGVITLEIGNYAEVHLTTGAAPSGASAYHSISRGMTADDRSWIGVPSGLTAYARIRASDDEDTKIAFTQS